MEKYFYNFAEKTTMALTILSFIVAVVSFCIVFVGAKMTGAGTETRDTALIVLGVSGYNAVITSVLYCIVKACEIYIRKNT